MEVQKKGATNKNSYEKFRSNMPSTSHEGVTGQERQGLHSCFTKNWQGRCSGNVRVDEIMQV